MFTIQELIPRVGNWSQENFGDQVSDSIKIVSDSFGARGCLGHYAPLMGLMEELGELTAAIEAHTVPEIIDSIGDMGIYLCDFCNRSRFGIPRDIVLDPQGLSPMGMLTVSLGRLFHVNLKRAQGIRGFDVDAHYIRESDKAIRQLVAALVLVSQRHAGCDFLQIVNETWESVSRRNWKKAKTDGVSDNAGVEVTTGPHIRLTEQEAADQNIDPGFQS